MPNKDSRYYIWANMIQRCYTQHHKAYQWYGAKGISVCDRWRNSYRNFIADMGERPEGMTLDRIDASGNYEPANCRWATQQQQQRNRTNTKLDKQKADAIAALVHSGRSKQSVADEFGVSRALVRKIVEGKVWQ